MVNQKITPCLWFENNAEEAMNFYVDVFNGAPYKTQESKVVSIYRYEDGMQTPGIEKMVGKVLTGIFDLNGQRLICLDGGPVFKFNEAISLQIECEDQAEVDYFWEKLSAVSESEVCGWLKDKFGLSWQITPKRMIELLGSTDRKKAQAAVNALLKMQKINVAELEKAYENA